MVYVSAMLVTTEVQQFSLHNKNILLYLLYIYNETGPESSQKKFKLSRDLALHFFAKVRVNDCTNHPK